MVEVRQEYDRANAKDLRRRIKRQFQIIEERKRGTSRGFGRVASGNQPTPTTSGISGKAPKRQGIDFLKLITSARRIIGITNIDEILDLTPKYYEALCKGALGARSDTLNDSLMISSNVKPVAFVEDITDLQNQVNAYVKSISDLANNFGDTKVKATLSRKEKLMRLAQALY